MNINQLITQSESNILDFKQELTNPANIAVTMIAFSNSKGGKIVVGYNSDKKKGEKTPESRKDLSNRQIQVLEYLKTQYRKSRTGIT